MGRQLRLAQRGNVDLSFSPQDVATLQTSRPVFRAALREIRTYDAGASTERTNALDRTTTTGSVPVDGYQDRSSYPDIGPT